MIWKCHQSGEVKVQFLIYPGVFVYGRLVGLGFLPELLRRLYGCEVAGRERGRREGAVVAAVARGRREAARVYPARVSPGSLRKPETIICFCLISQIESYKYLYVSLIATIIK
jgi:hypothetical protein